MQKLALGILILFTSLGLYAAGPGAHSYKPIKPGIPTQSGDKIEVLEIFWYGCPHCYAFEPYAEKWQETLPADVVFRRVPAVLNKNWIPHARAYFAAEKLGVLERIHLPLFEALHKRGRRIVTEDDLQQFFVEQGLDGDEFTRAYHSQDVEIKVKQAFLTARRAGLTGVPALIVDGKYLTGSSMAGSHENLLKVIDQLVQKARTDS